MGSASWLKQIKSIKPQNQSFNLDSILIEKTQKVTRATNLILIGDLNAPNVNWKDMTTSSQASTFDSRLLSFWLNNVHVHHSILATRWVFDLRENHLDVLFTRTSKDKFHACALQLSCISKYWRFESAWSHFQSLYRDWQTTSLIWIHTVETGHSFDFENAKAIDHGIRDHKQSIGASRPRYNTKRSR